MHGSGNHKRRRCPNSISSHLADDVTAIVSSVFGWRRTMGRSKLQQLYYDLNRVGSYGGVAALRRVVPRTGRRTLVIGTGYIHTSQTGETSFQTLLRRSRRSKPAVASRLSRLVAVEEGQRWNYIHTDGGAFR